MSYETPDAVKQQRQKDAVSAAIAQIERLFSSNPRPALMKDTSPTGSLGLDCLLGGGWPSTGIVEVFGESGSGKSTLALSTIERAQKAGKNCAYINMEHSFDPSYAEAIGVDTENLIVAEPTTGEEALEIAYILASSGSIQVIVIDSVAAMVPKLELEAGMGEERVMHVLGRMLSKALIKIKQLTKQEQCLFVFVNQTRFRLVEGHPQGGYRVTPGGEALNHYADVRLDMRLNAPQPKGSKAGIFASSYVVSNKATGVKGNISIPIAFGKGIVRPLELLEMAIVDGDIVVEDEAICYQNGFIGSNKAEACDWLEQNTEASVILWKKARANRLAAPSSPIEKLVNKRSAA